MDYNLMSTIPGLVVIDEANFADHGANRLGVSSLVQGLADGYFILPYTIGHYLATAKLTPVGEDHQESRAAIQRVTSRISRPLNSKGCRSAASFPREVGQLLWNHCGISRNEEGLKSALTSIPAFPEEFWRSVMVSGSGEAFNQELGYAGRVADYLEFAELLCHDALCREESCGAHFREEYQTDEGEPQRDDSRFAHVAAWKYREGASPIVHKEPLGFEFVPPTTRSYQ